MLIIRDFFLIICRWYVFTVQFTRIFVIIDHVQKNPLISARCGYYLKYFLSSLMLTPTETVWIILYDDNDESLEQYALSIEIVKFLHLDRQHTHLLQSYIQFLSFQLAWLKRDQSNFFLNKYESPIVQLLDGISIVYCEQCYHILILIRNLSREKKCPNKSATISNCEE